jgi:hypothetical protein
VPIRLGTCVSGHDAWGPWPNGTGNVGQNRTEPFVLNDRRLIHRPPIKRPIRQIDVVMPDRQPAIGIIDQPLARQRTGDLVRFQTRSWRIAVLSAGIRSLLWNSQRNGPRVGPAETPATPGRDNPGMTDEIISERRAKSSRNRWATSFRNHGRLPSESAMNQRNNMKRAAAVQAGSSPRCHRRQRCSPIVPMSASNLLSPFRPCSSAVRKCRRRTDLENKLD